MFTIFGASGNTGSVVAEALLARGEKVKVLARSKAKVAALAARGVTIVEGDVTSADAVDEALRGAKGAYLLLPPDPSAEDLFLRNRNITESYAAALRKHGVAHAVLLSSIGAQLPKGTGPIATLHEAEQILARVGATKTTFLRAAYFVENLFAYAPAMRGDGVLPVFGGVASHPFPWVATADIGRVAAEALLAPPATTEVVELEGPKDYSFDDAASAAAAILGRPVATVAVPIEQLVPTLTGFGVSVHFAGLVREMTEGFAKGAIAFERKGRSVRGAVTLADALRPALA